MIGPESEWKFGEDANLLGVTPGAELVKSNAGSYLNLKAIKLSRKAKRDAGRRIALAKSASS
jgi:hypothetical protein